MKNSIIILLAVWVVSCKDLPNIKSIETPVDRSVSQNQEAGNTGKLLLETQCYGCHNATTHENERLAPPMIAIKTRYLKDLTSKKDFADAIWAFVEKPTVEKVIMKGALDRFGLMPYQPFEEKDIRLISDYMFEFQIEAPSWSKRHSPKGYGKKNNIHQGKRMRDSSSFRDEDPMKKGLVIAQSTQKVLGKNLMAHLQQNGAIAALEFCNEKAYPLTDSMATVYNAEIRRVSDKPRNPKNQATIKELEYIEYYKDRIAADLTYAPILKEDDESINFYYPIVTNTMCLTCHGIPKTTIQPNVLLSLNKSYPYDKAVGYKVNEVRGIWSIGFKSD